MKGGIRSAGLAMWIAAALAGFANLTSAQDYVVNKFDLPDDALLWSRWWGSAPQTYEFDYSMDAQGNPKSGSLKASVEFNLGSYGGDNQFAVLRNLDTGTILDGTKYTNLVFELRVDPNSPKNAAGDFGYLEYGFRNSDWTQTWLGGQAIPASASAGWIQIVAPINPTLAKLDSVAGIVLKLWSGGTGGLTGTTTFWVDDVALVANKNTTTPPPSMSLAKATSGLQLSSSASGQQYQRQNIHTLGADADGNPNLYSWIGRAEPVTYSMKIKDFPDAAHSGYQAHIFLVPENSLPNGPGDASVDWNAANVVFVQIGNNADGTATARFMYKINQPNGNTMLWNTDPGTGPVGSLASITDSSARGTWSVSFKNNTDITLTTPSGTSTNFAMPTDAAGLFSDSIFAYFGTQPNNTGNIGQAATLSRIQITGTATPLDDNFTADTLDASKWALAAADGPGITQIPPSGLFWLKWNAPATGFGVEGSPTLASGSWKDVGLNNIIQVGPEKRVLITSATLPGSANGFFRLRKP